MEGSKNSELGAEDLLTSFTTLFNSAATTCKPKSPHNTNKKKKKGEKKAMWFSSKCKTAKTRYNRALKNYRNQPFNRNLQQILINARKVFKRICKESERKFRQTLSNKLLSIEGSNPKEFWNLIDKMRRWGTPNEDPSNCIHPSEWMSHFQTLLNDGPATAPSLIEELEKCEQYPVFSELDFRISDEEISKAFQKLNLNASPGVDNIPGELLHVGMKYLLPMYSKILNKIFSNASYPNEWTKNS